MCRRERRNSLRFGCLPSAPPVEVLKKHLLRPRVGWGGQGVRRQLFSCCRPHLPSSRSETGWLFDFSTENICIQQSIKWCWQGAFFFRAGRETQGRRFFFQHRFPQLNVQRTVFFKRHILHYWGFSYHFIYICIFVPCDLFLIAFIAGRSLLNESAPLCFRQLMLCCSETFNKTGHLDVCF